jgi:tetratricopeptide (TPR) repeat protein
MDNHLFLQRLRVPDIEEDDAYLLLMQAQEQFRELGLVAAVVQIEVRLAELDYMQGYYGSALHRYYQARDTIHQSDIIEGPILLWEIKLRIADCLVKLNRAVEACQLAEEAVRMYRRAGGPLDTGNALCQYASALVACGRPGEALSALDEAEAVFSQGGFDHHACTARLHRAELLLSIDTVVEADALARLVKAFFDAHDLLPYAIRASLVIVGAFIKSAKRAGGDEPASSLALQEALTLCEAAIAQARQHNLQEQVYKGLYLSGQLADLQGDIKQATRHYKAAIAQVELILDDLAHDLSPAFLHTAWAIYEEMIALCLRLGKAERAFKYLERGRSVVLRQYLNRSKLLSGKEGAATSQAGSAAMLQMQREFEEWQRDYRAYSLQLANYDASASHAAEREVIQAELRRCEAKLSELSERLHLYDLRMEDTLRPPRSRQGRRRTYAIEQIDAAQLRQRLAPDQILLAYFLYQGRLVIFAATPERLITCEQADGERRLESLWPLLYAHLQPAGWPDAQRPPQQVIRRLLHKLYDLLITPIAHMLPPVSGHLTIVPYGPLHKLPFHALYNGSRFLIQDFQISYLPASSILVRLPATQKDESDPAHAALQATQALKSPLVFGYSGNGHLPRALDEAKAVAEMLHGRRSLEQEATIARLLQEAPGSSIIHLATHGHSRLDAPAFSSVLLADGQLTTFDVFGLDLRGCELVTLSGCETGLSLSGGGDEQLGMGRAFLAAGASSLVMSLWPVEDNSTNALMQIFYQRLLRGDSKVQALRTAQCYLLTQTAPPYPHPYFWAAFRLVGDVGPLRRRP